MYEQHSVKSRGAERQQHTHGFFKRGNTLMPYVKTAAKNRKKERTSQNIKAQKQGIIRGADYYRKDGNL